MNRSNDLYQKVTDEIIAALEEGVIPWVRLWREGEPVVPMNALSGRFYHGINIPLLWNSAERQGYESDRWLTFTQFRNAGGNVRKGEKSKLAPSSARLWTATGTRFLMITATLKWRLTP